MGINTFDVVAYTDGAGKGNPVIGGWGVHLIADACVSELYGGELNTDINRMELKAVVVALENTPRPSKIAIYSDSSYVVDGVSSWIPTWSREWGLSEKVPVKNSDLWRVVRDMSKKHKISWFKIKGHSGNLGNTLADRLADKGIKSVYDCQAR